MKCYSCNTHTSINRWRVINLSTDKRGNTQSKTIYTRTNPGVSQFSVLYACPRCGTIRIKTPLDK